jgi:hypothetical protein
VAAKVHAYGFADVKWRYVSNFRNDPDHSYWRFVVDDDDSDHLELRIERFYDWEPAAD